ncbi:small ribosomal subunit protein uS15m [Prorops nasuta]|uniref:small ribosomal subunit protein uS15m n=1 Tax=Prorops nasuta TaxID=863751 RepID=UPI0034CE23AC
MNIIRRSVSITKAISPFLNNGSFVIRAASSKVDKSGYKLGKIEWLKPEPIPFYKPERTGDYGISIDLKETDLINYFNNVPEVLNSDEKVKSLFTLKLNPRKEVVNLKREKIIALVKRHNLDRGSAEVKIAAMTVEILQLLEIIEEHRGNKKMKTFLKELIDKRNKYLKYLRKWDYKRFEWILEKLNLVYKPAPLYPKAPTRKDSLRKLVKEHCDNLINSKLNAYKEELKCQQEMFYKEKAEKLAFIRAEEIACGVTPTVNEEDIEEARKKFEELTSSK